jgi:hypothetical protein
MTTTKARFATYNNSKIGNQLQFLDLPFYADDMRLSYKLLTIVSMKVSKTGKRVSVTFCNGLNLPSIGLNTPFEDITDKFLNEISTERGWK